MKKRTVKMMSLVLAALLIASLVVPVMAASGTGREGQYDYEWTLTKTSSSGTAWIRTPHTPTTVGASARNKVRSSIVGEAWTYSEGSTENNPVPITGYASIGATASNLFTRNSVVYSGTVLETHGTFWINSKMVIADARSE